MGGDKNKVKLEKTCCNGVICYRCRWIVYNIHLHKTLKSYGCVPKKSLILKFPKESIFKSSDLIRHFIRGYWDGDGCLTWADKEHKVANISVLGTKSFLTSI